MSKRIIYCLKCPFTNDIHYIGKSTSGMTRPLQHIKNFVNEKMKLWIEDLKILGEKPVVEILEYVSELEDLDAKERWWIQQRINEGDLLLNINLILPETITPNLEGLLSEGKGENLEINQIATFVKERRKSVGLTQEEFAYKMGIALTVLRKIEQGKTNINLDGLLIILKTFGHTITVKNINRNI